MSEPANLYTVTLVRFYRASDKPYGCFSNLFKRTMSFDGRFFDTAEHAYQFGKARKPAVAEWLMAAPSPSLLAGAAHSLLSWDIAPGWSRNRRERMRKIVEAKFRQHADLAAILLDTDNAQIIESATTDNEVNRRWGQIKKGDQWIGQNWLGEILMEVRDVLRAEFAAIEAARKGE